MHTNKHSFFHSLIAWSSEKQIRNKPSVMRHEGLTRRHLKGQKLKRNEICYMPDTKLEISISSHR